MKFLIHHFEICRNILVFFFVVLASLPVLGQESILGQTASDWTGVSYQVVKIQRVGPDRILVVVRIVANATAQNPTFLGTMKTVPKNATVVEMSSGKYDPTPLMLTKAILVDQQTDAKYSAQPDVPSAPFFGPNMIMTNLRPGGWIQLAVAFPAPPSPAADANGKVPAQKVSIAFPMAKLPAKDIPLPPAHP